MKRPGGYIGWIFAVSAAAVSTEALASCNGRSQQSVSAALTPAGASPAAGGGAAVHSDVAPPATPGSAAVARALTASVEQGDAPGVVGLVVDRDGVLFEGAAGQSSVANAQPMPTDAIFNIASMTKPVTSVAVMQLYEQGKLGLDDPVSKFLPGLGAPKVLTSYDALSSAYATVPAHNVMTLRHLLSHTSGIGYAFCNRALARLQDETQRPEWQLPLLSEPGSRWHYGASTRLLGMIVEQLSGQSLESYFQAHIFAPLGMHDTSYAVPAEKRGRVPALQVRAADGRLQESPRNDVPATPTPPFMGDGGLYSTAHDYGRFMRMFLNAGSLEGARILSEHSVQLMGQNQIGALFVEQQEAALPEVTKPFPLGAGKDKFGFGFEISAAGGSSAQRSAGSLGWAGLFNTEFWIDPRAHVAGTLLMQLLPFYDEGAIRALQKFEAAVYQELLPQRSG